MVVGRVGGRGRGAKYIVLLGLTAAVSAKHIFHSLVQLRCLLLQRVGCARGLPFLN